MPDESVFHDLIAFFDRIPDAVRAEISLLLVALADDHPVESEEVHTCERAARGLFNAESRLGRFGNLIDAVADRMPSCDGGFPHRPSSGRVGKQIFCGV